MQKELEDFIQRAFVEDIGEGDHTSLSCIPESAKGSAKLLVKEIGILAGVDVAKSIATYFDSSLKFDFFMNDGDIVKPGDIAFEISGSARSILTTERLILNCMQRMSGIATQTNSIVKLIEGTNATLLDTRKTTPGLRFLEKWAVKIGGGQNHRFGLYDMIMIKDNHVDFAGGIQQALENVKNYQQSKNLNLKVELEVRNERELDEALAIGGFDRVMLDNFSPEQIKLVLPKIPNTIETEASGGITIETIRNYAETGVQFISVGALTHSVKSLDLSLKSIFNN
jgi:nicotinate-nucleotide pyrophosphorylase (carboxylating)